MRSFSNRGKITFGMAAVLAAVLMTALGSLTGTGPLLLGGGQAEARIGRPATPASFAGVARRTTRRTAYATAATYQTPTTYVAPVVVAPTAVVTSLPAGCTSAADDGTYQCGGTQYVASYNGTTLVYQQL